jgi:mono/diheme cytochrome c family protein
MPVSRVVALAAAMLLVVVQLSGAQQRAVAAAAPESSASPGTGGNLEHGRYLVERVVMCAECHSTRDSQGNVVPGTRFKGGPMPGRPMWPVDWPEAFPRIAGLPGYTDAQAIRLLTQGAIKRDGTQLRAPMPRFRMTPEDAAAVVAYLRSM